MRILLDDCEVRVLDKEARTAEFIAATQNGVMTWRGREYLVMRGIDLKRYRKNPIVLFNHDFNRPIGYAEKIEVDREQGRLLLTVKFGRSARAAEAWQDVQDKILRAMSVAFLPDRESVRLVEEGQTYQKKGLDITGPAMVIERWMPYENSVVSVPADPDALRRDLDAAFDQLAEEVRQMADKDKQQEQPQQGAEQETQPRSQQQTDDAHNPQEQRQQDPQPLSKREQVARDIRAIAPDGMRREADAAILEHPEDFEAARKQLLDAFKAKHEPVGTPEPAQPAERAEKQDDEKAETPDFVRSLTSMSD
jgi:phage head maturation protease